MGLFILKSMDSFGTWQKLNFIYFFVNAEFYRVVWTINALLTVRSEMLPFSGNNQNIKMFGVLPNTLSFFFVNAESYRVVWTINALLTVRSEMLPFSENNQNIKMFGVPPNTLS